MKYIIYLLCPLLIEMCQSEKQENLPNEIKDQYFTATKAADECTDLLTDYEDHKSINTFLELSHKIPEMSFDFSGVELTEEQYHQCRLKKMKIDSLKRVIKNIINNDLPQYPIVIAQETDKLINSSFSLPFYAKRNDNLRLTATSDNKYSFKIYNADSRKLIYSSNNKNLIDDIIPIANSAVYLLDFNCKSPTYIDYSLSKNAKKIEELTEKYKIAIDTIPCLKDDFRSKKVEGMKLKNLFAEPRKVTLRSQGKALFSGSTRSLVALNIPHETEDIMYSLRISTSDSDHDSDGNFFDKTSKRYHEIRFLGLPIYESTRNNNSLIRELLSFSKPEPEEEAYCNMYVFKTAGEARKFQNHKPITDLQYNLDHSIVGTQSCNGRIPVKGMKTLYIGFENEKITSSVYIWLEVIGTIHSTEYFKEKYVIIK